MKHIITLIFLSLVLTTCQMEKNNQKDLYTLGIWKVKPGKRSEFINEWTSFAKWTGKNVPGAGIGYLLADENDTLRFISFGPWDNENSIKKWRENERFKGFVKKVEELCDEFQPNTLKVISGSE